jgi:phosphate-selective porin OprO/OprP
MLMFMERASYFDAQFTQEFDPGVQVFNSAFDKRLNWAFAFHRNDPEHDIVDVGTGDYAFTGRLAAVPFYQNEGRHMIHVAGSWQYRAGDFTAGVNERTVRFRARPDIRESTLLPRFVDTGNIITDHVNTFGVEFLAIMGPLSIQAEYFNARVSDPTVGGVIAPGQSFSSWYAQASYFLTGENRGYDKRMARLDRTKINENFFFVRDAAGGTQLGLGAWEVAARIDQVDLRSGNVNGGMMWNYTAGLNWYLNNNAKVQFNYIATDRHVAPTEAGATGFTHFFGTRFHYDF